MKDLRPEQLAKTIALCEPLNIRTIAFDTSTFDLLKHFQRNLECVTKRDTGNAEILKYLIHTHPEAKG